MSFFLVSFSSFSLLFFLHAKIIWSVGVLCDHLFAWASKTHSRRCLRWGTFRYSRGCLRPPRYQSKFGVMNFIDFPCKPVIIEHLKISKPLLSLNRQHRHPEGIPGSNRGWTLVFNFYFYFLFLGLIIYFKYSSGYM